MPRLDFGKGLSFLALITAAAFSSTEARAGWFSHARPADCGAEITRHQAKAESACDLALARQMAGLDCAGLAAFAERDRQIANGQALSSYHRVFMPTTYRVR